MMGSEKSERQSCIVDVSAVPPTPNYYSSRTQSEEVVNFINMQRV